MNSLGIDVECQHHEVATAGQAEIDMRFKPLVEMGDQLMWFKYVLKNVAHKYGHTVTFMPKPLFNDNGTGMHTHCSIWKDDKPLFAGDKYAGVSQEALYAIGGILKHCRALCAFTNPTTNSYKRLVPGFEAPVNSGLFQPEPECSHPNSHVLTVAQGQTDRVQNTGSFLQRLYCVFRHTHGHDRWY